MDPNPRHSYDLLCERCHVVRPHRITCRPGGGVPTIQGPADPDEWSARCTVCGHETDLPAPGECPRCPECGCLMPELDMPGEHVCRRCVDLAMDDAIAGLGWHVTAQERAWMAAGALAEGEGQ